MQQLCPYEVIFFPITSLELDNLWLTIIADCGFGIFQVLWAVHWRRVGRLQLCVGVPYLHPRSFHLKVLFSIDLGFWCVNLPYLNCHCRFCSWLVGYCRYGSAFGSPVARVQGIGYIQELVARLTHTPIATHNSSTNATLNDNPITFPLGQSLYVDATHEVVVLNSRDFF